MSILRVTLVGDSSEHSHEFQFTDIVPQDMQNVTSGNYRDIYLHYNTGTSPPGNIYRAVDYVANVARGTITNLEANGDASGKVIVSQVHQGLVITTGSRVEVVDGNLVVFLHLRAPSPQNFPPGTLLRSYVNFKDTSKYILLPNVLFN